MDGGVKAGRTGAWEGMARLRASKGSAGEWRVGRGGCGRSRSSGGVVYEELKKVGDSQPLRTRPSHRLRRRDKPQPRHAINQASSQASTRTHTHARTDSRKGRQAGGRGQSRQLEAVSR